MAPTSRRSTTTFRPAPTRRVQRNVDSDHDDSVVLDPASSDDGSDNDDDNCVRVNNNDLNNVNIVVVDDNGCAADAGWQLYEGRQHLDGEQRCEFHHRLELGSIGQPNC
jgi:hypothetical protein